MKVKDIMNSSTTRKKEDEKAVRNDGLLFYHPEQKQTPKPYVTQPAQQSTKRQTVGELLNYGDQRKRDVLRSIADGSYLKNRYTADSIGTMPTPDGRTTFTPTGSFSSNIENEVRKLQTRYDAIGDKSSKEAINLLRQLNTQKSILRQATDLDRLPLIGSGAAKQYVGSMEGTLAAGMSAGNDRVTTTKAERLQRSIDRNQARYDAMKNKDSDAAKMLEDYIRGLRATLQVEQEKHPNDISTQQVREQEAQAGVDSIELLKQRLAEAEPDSYESVMLQNELENKQRENVENQNVLSAMQSGERATAQAQSVMQSGSEDLERAQEGLGWFGRLGVQAASAALQMGGDVALAAATGGSTMLPMLLRSFGGGAMDAESKGYDITQQIEMGLTSAMTEYVTEKLFGGNPIYDNDTGLVNRIVAGLVRDPKTSKLLAALNSVPADIISEGLEEAISEIADPYIENAIAGTRENKVDWSNVGMSTLTGMMLGGIGQVTDAISPINGARENSEAINQLAQAVAEDKRRAAQTQAVDNAAVNTLEQLAQEKVAAENPGTSQTEQAAPAAPRVITDAAVRQNQRSANEAASTFGENGSKAFNTFYDAETARTLSPQDAFAGFSSVYDSIINGKEMTEQQAEAAAKLPEAMRVAAEGAARKDLAYAAQAKYFGEDSGLVQDDYYKQNVRISSRERRRLDALAKVLGVKLRFVSELESGVNGKYDNGEILLSTKSDKPFQVTAIHETVHRLRETSPDLYASLSSFVMENGAQMPWLQDMYKDAYGENATPSALNEEIVADAYATILENSTLLDKFVVENRTVAEKLRDLFNDILLKVKQALDGSGKLRLDQMQIEAFRELQKNIGRMETQLTDALRSAEKVTKESTAKVGVNIDAKTESASASKASLNTWNASDYMADKKKAAESLAKTLGVSTTKAAKFIDDVNTIAKIIANDKMRLDYDASPNVSAFVSNTEYGGSIDFSTICKKRRLFTGTYEAIQKAIGDSPITAEEVLQIRKMMEDKGYEVACGLCYVEGSRAKLGEYSQAFKDEYAKTNPEYMPTMSDLTTPTGVENLRLNHPDTYDAYVKYMNSLAQRKPKLFQSETEYKGEILKKFSGKNAEENVKAKNINGGLRLQSFSDFEIIHLIDTMQVIMDMSRVGLAGQAYTKVADFARAVGDTGLKINLSLIAKDVDANGHLVLDEVNGMKRAEAEELRTAHSDNVGTICVVFTDAQLKAAMADPFIDFIIPFHRSQWNSAQYSVLGLPANTKDYTPVQNESYVEPVFNKNGKKQRPENYMPNEYWDFSLTGKENAQKYLDMCWENNRKPKFTNVLEKDANGKWQMPADGSADGYWKLLIDFKMYNNEGVGVPQRPVSPNFDMKQAERMLKEYTGGHQAFPVAQDIVDEFVANRGKYSKDVFAPTFYSQMEKTIGEIKQAKLGASSVVSYLRGRGVKAEEIKWSGIEEWLQGKKSVTKEELQQFAAASDLQIEETTLSNEEMPMSLEHQSMIDRYTYERDGFIDELKQAWKEKIGTEFPIRNPGMGVATSISNALYKANTEKKKASGAGADMEAVRDEFRKIFDEDDFGYDSSRQAYMVAVRDPMGFAAAYDLYEDQLEVFQRFADAKAKYNSAEGIPVADQQAIIDIAERADAANRVIVDTKSAHYAQQAKRMPKWGEYRTRGENYRELLFRMPGSDYTNNAMNVHWGDTVANGKGVLAHARMQDVATADGDVMLFIEEIQSDWHNAGKKNGYGDNEYELREGIANGKKAHFLYENGEKTHGWVYDWEYENENGEFDKTAAMEELMGAYGGQSQKAPDAPFKDNYTDFVLKRLIRMAAEQDYDSIGWTTAEMQSKRWSDKYAEGYRIEYDQDIPKFLNKYGKKWGASVTQTQLDSGETVWQFNIPNNMKASVLYEGQPKYSKNVFNSDETIAKQAQANYNYMLEVINNDNSNRQSKWTASPSEQVRLRKIYETDALSRKEDKTLYCDALRRAGGIQRGKVTEGYYDLDVQLVKEEFYTYEMLSTAKRNALSGLETRFFVDNMTYADNGDSRGVDGLADTDNNILYIKINSENGSDRIVRENKFTSKTEYATQRGALSLADLSKHERFHGALANANSNAHNAAQKLFEFVDDRNGKYVKYFDEINYWYQRTSTQDGYDFSDYSQEVAADIYAGALRITDPRIKKEVLNLVSEIDDAIGGNKKYSRNVDYSAAVEKYGAIEPGEKPYRDVEVPTRINDRTKVSKTVRTVMEAEVTPETMIPNIEDMVADGTFSYTPYSDEAAINDAADKIKGDGWGDALNNWIAESNKGGISKANTALGWALYNNAANSGNTQTALTILDTIIRNQRNAAQALQATRILKQMSPEAQLYEVSKSIKNLEKELTEKWGEQKNIKIKVDEDLAADFLKARNDETRAEILTEIYKDVGRQLPSSFKDKFNAWRYLAMLGNPRTHVRNVLGNAFFAPVVGVKNLTGTAIEASVKALGYTGLERTKSIVGFSEADRSLLKAAAADFANVEDDIMGGGKYSDFANANAQVEEGRQIFGNTKLEAWNKTGGRVLEGARKGNSYLLDVEDKWFSQPHYAHALASYCKANGITADQIASGKGLDAARRYAIKEAQKATYRDTNAFSEAVSSISRLRRSENKVAKGVGILMEGILPFKKTPANILARGVEYSPLGLLNGMYDAFRNVKRGKISAAEAIDEISAGLTGTGLLAFGFFLASQGIVRGHGGDDEKKKKFEAMQGHQDYSLKIGNTSVTIDWLAPEALPFFVGVNLYESKSDGKLTVTDGLQAFKNITEPLLEMSCLQSLNALFESSKGYDDSLSGVSKVVSNSLTSLVTQVVPTLGGQFERTFENKRYASFTTKDNAFLTPDMQYTISKVSAKIPGWDYQQIPYIDAWGRYETTGNIGQRAVNNLANPAFVSKIDSSATENELLRLYDQLGDDGVFPTRAGKYIKYGGESNYLTADEYVKYLTQKGQNSLNLVDNLIASDYYKNLSDDDKVSAIKEMYTLADVIAKHKVMPDYKATDWKEKLYQTCKSLKMDYAEYYNIRAKVKDIDFLKDSSGESIKLTQGLQRMLYIYDIKGLTDKQRQQLFEDFEVPDSIKNLNKAAAKQKLNDLKKKAK